MQKKILLLLSVILVFVTSVVYSALSTSLSITSEVRFRVLADIRVNGVTMSSANGGILAYDSEYSKNTVSNGFTLPTQGSSISYTVHVDNTGDVDYAIYDILQTTVASGLDVTVSGYNLQDVIPARTSVNLVLTYTTSNPSNSVINVVNTFDFKKVHYIDYVTGTSQTIPQQIKYEGVPLTLTSTQPTKNGYAFSKWNTKSDGTGTNYDSGATYTVDEDPYVRNVTLYARYNLNTYNITYQLNGGTNNSNNPSTYSVESNTITLADATKSGWTFTGWTGNGTTTPTKNLTLAKGSTGNKEYTAHFEKQITLTQKHGITTTSQQYTLKDSEIDHTFTLVTSADTFSGWTFEGWLDDVTPKAPDYGKTATITLSSDKTVYATYSRAISATFIDYNGLEKQTRVLSGTAYGNNSCGGVGNQYPTVTSPTQGTYTGWTSGGFTTSTEANATSSLASNTSFVLNNNQTYYGIYSQNVTLTYNANGASVVPNTQSGVRKTNSYAINSLNNPTFTLANALSRNNYDFGGWNVSAPINAIKAAGTTITPTSGASITATAVWTPITYSITYTLNNGTNNSNNPSSYNVESAAITLAAPTKTLTFKGNYNATSGANAASGQVTIGSNTTQAQTFAGWSGTGLSSNTVNVTIPTGSSGNRSYTAHWTAVAGTVPTVTRTGYTCGWSTSSTGTTIEIASGESFPTSSITEDMTSTVNLYAVCNPNTYQLTINPQGGTYNSTTSNSTKTMTYDASTNNDIGVPTRDGYTFDGWYIEANSKTNQLFNNTGKNTALSGYFSAAYSTGVWKKTSPVTVYAHWSKAASSLTNSVSPTTYIYDGTAKSPTETVKDGSTTLTNGTDYTVAFSNNTNVGTATATITGKNVYNATTKAYYTGTATVNYYINNATLTFNVGNCDNTSGTTTLYTRKNATAVYTGIRNATEGSIPTASKSGYTFQGWYDASSNGNKVLNANGTFSGTAVTNYTNATSWQAVANQNLYAVCTRNSYSITYSMNNGTNHGDNPNSYNVEDPTITLKDPTKTLIFEGHPNATSGANAASGTVTIGNNTSASQTFAGWIGSNGNTPQKYPNVTIPSGSEGNKDYEAKWTKVAGTLPTVTREGYTCGWSTSSTATTATYTSGGTFPISDIDEDMSATVDLYAVCNPNTYQLTINPNSGTYNGTTGTSTKTMTYDSSNNNDIGVATRSDRDLNGWYLDPADRDTIIYSSQGKNINEVPGYWSDVYPNGVWKKTSAVTVYAAWIIFLDEDPITKAFSQSSFIYNGSPQGPTVTVSDGNTTLVNGTDYYYSQNANTNVGEYYAVITGRNNYNATTKTRYIGNYPFLFYINNAKLTFDVGSCASVNGDTTLYAKKDDANVYTGIRETTTTGTIPTASKNGYTFQGWYTAASNGTKVLNANGTFTGTAVANYSNTNSWNMTENKTLYAVCTPNNYTVTANANAGTISSTSGWTGTGSTSTKSVIYGSTYGTLPNVSKDGYTFNGWSLLPEGYQQVDYVKNSDGSIDLDTTVSSSNSSLIQTAGIQFDVFHGGRQLMGGNGDLDNYFGIYYDGSSNAYFDIGNRGTYNIELGKKYDLTLTSDGSKTRLIAMYNNTVVDNFTANNGQIINSDFRIFRIAAGYLMNDVRIYYYGISIDGEYVFYGIPCYKKSNNEVGFYDIIGKKFYGKTAGSDFTYGSTVSNYLTSSSVVNIPEDHNIYAHWTINNPATPTITGGATKVFGSSATTLTCSTSTNYASGTTKTYSFGYANSDGGTPSNWTSFSSSATLNVGAEAYIGQRWYSCKVKASDGVQTTSEVASATTADTEMTINNAKITWDTNSCGTLSGTSPAYVKKGTTGVYTGIRNTTAGTMASVSKSGYTFNGWYDGTTKVINDDGTIVASVSNWTDSSKNWLITADKTLKASCTRINYSITYSLNNGTNNANNPSSYHVESETITLAAPTKTLTFHGNVNSTSGANAASGQVTIGSNTTQAQTFAGWTGSNGSTAQTTVIIPTGSTGDKSYTAHWTAVAGTVPTVTRTGYTCGWSTSSTGTTIEIASGGSYATSRITEAMAATVNLYAVCNPNTYQLTINPNGGTYNSTTSNSTKTMTYDSTNNNDIGTPTRSGYTFAGWYTQENGGVQLFGTDGHNTNAEGYWSAAYSTGVWKKTSAVTVYAKWTKAVGDLTKSVSPTSYIYDGSAKGPTPSVSDGSTALVKDTDYTVSYSNNTNVGTATATITGKNIYNSTTHAYYTGTTTVTYYINNATLSFNVGNCSSVSASTLYTKKGATKVYTGIRTTTEGSIPTVTVPTGYTFQGWYNANSGGSKVLNANGGFTGTAVTNYTDASSWQTVADQNLYARCTANTYTIGYTMNGGPDPSSKPTSGTYNSDVQISNPSSKVITISGDANGTGATVGSATTVTQTFSGWTSSSGAGLGSGAKSGTSASPTTAWDGTSTKNTYFRNLRDSSGTVTMTANWNTAAGTLPTLTNPTGYTCKYYSASTGGSELGVGGASYTPGATSGTSITVYVRCTANSYSIAYTMNGGPDPSSKPNGGTFNADVQISNPSSKVITITASANGTSATVGSATTVTQTFSGWTSSSSAGLGGNAKSGTSASPTTAWDGTSTKNTYFRNLRDSSGTVTMTANWNTAAGTLPTLTNPTGYTCKYYSASTGGSELGVGGASYTPGATSGTSITVYARCTANTYTIAYSMNNGPNPSTKPTSGTYNSDVQISNPGSKSITVTGNVNGTGASIGSATTGTQTFTGWTSSSGAGLGSGAKSGTSASPTTAWTGSSTTNTYFKNLRDSSGTVTMTANWSGSMTLPTLSKAGHTCRWYTDPTSGSEMGAGGATWTIPNGSSTSVTAYARCTVNNYNVTFDNNYLASNIWANTSRTSSYGSSGVDPTAKIEVEDSSVANGYYIEFTMPTGSGGGPYYPAAKLTNGQTYTWSVEVKASKSTSLTIGHEQGGTKSVDITTSWQRFTHTFTANNGNYTAFVFYYGSWTAGDKLYVKNLYIEVGNGNQNKSTSSKQYASQLGTLSSPTRTGYTFAGWFTAPTGGTQISTTTTVPANDVTYYAHWTANKYYLDLNGWLDGASSGGISPYGTADVYVNGSIQSNDTTDYYTQWYTGSTYQISDIKATTGHTYVGVHSGSLTGTIAGSNVGTVLEFTTDSHTVSYSCTENEGTGTVSSASVAYNTAVNLPSTGCTKNGWTFLGWNTNKDATSALSAGDVVMGTSNITLYAIYRKQLTATLSENNGATISPTSNSCYIYNKQQTCGVSITSITPQSGFSVIGINNNSSATTSSSSYNTSSKILTISSSGTWYPITSKTNTATFTITDTNAATGGGQVSCTRYNGAASCTITASTITAKSGYVALGWNATQNATNATINSGQTNVSINSDITYYSVTYLSATVTVTFNKTAHVTSQTPYGGSASTAASVTVSCTKYNGASSCTIKSPTFAVDTGYHVGGYIIDGGSTTWDVNTDKSVSSNATYNSVAAGNVYSIHFNANCPSGTTASGSMANQSKTYGTPVTLNANAFSCTNRVFAGWATSASGEVVYSDGGTFPSSTDPISTAGGTTELYAKWRITPPGTPTISSSASTKVYGASASLTCTENTTYPSGITKYFQFASTTTNGATPEDNAWSAKSTSNTFDITNADLGVKYYSCRVWAEKDAESSITKVSASNAQAQVTINNATLTFNAGNCGTVSSSTAYVRKGTAITSAFNGIRGTTSVSLPTFTAASGKSFNGWYSGNTLVIDSGGLVVAGVSNWTDSNNKWLITSDQTLTASCSNVGYNITYAMQNGTNNGSNPSSYNVTTSDIVLQAPTKTLSFVGHYNETSGANASSLSGVVIDSPNPTTQAQDFLGWSIGIGANMGTTIYSSITIPQGSTGDKSYTARWGAVAGTVPTVHKTGYTCGWSLSSSGTSIDITSGGTFGTSRISEGMATTVDLYAVCTPNTYQVAYNGNGATSGTMSNSTHTYGVAKNLTSNAYTRTGYVFTGWNTAADGSGTSYSNGESVTNLSTGTTVTLYAQWVELWAENISYTYSDCSDVQCAIDYLWSMLNRY